VNRTGIPKRSGGPSADRQANDLYPAPPEATLVLLREEKFIGKIWECASGEGHISKVLIEAGHKVVSTDKYAKQYGYGKTQDFFACKKLKAPNVVTNPPYGLLNEFLEKVLQFDAIKIALHLPMPSILSVGRREIFIRYGFPDRVYVFSPSLKVRHRVGEKPKTSIFNHTWCVWDGVSTRRTELKWVNWRTVGEMT
jgi:hypothetical protein